VSPATDIQSLVYKRLLLVPTANFKQDDGSDSTVWFVFVYSSIDDRGSRQGQVYTGGV